MFTGNLRQNYLGGPETMVELLAAAIGAGIGVVASGVGNFVKKDAESSLAVVRLTSAVEHIAAEVSLLRREINEDRKEMYPRLNSMEQRIAVLETKL